MLALRQTADGTRPGLRQTAIAFVLYLALAILLLHPLVARFSTHILADDVFVRPGLSDAYNFLWSYWWIQKAVCHGWNLYHCDWVYPPTGANLFFHAHVILPTLLTLPFGLLFGATAGYNIMIVLLLTGAATVYEAFLRATFAFRRSTSLIAGALFGFCPYFVFKTHAHVNLVGGVFWGGCLAALVYAYVRDAFSWRSGLVFSLGLWSTFWTSFVEFFALLVVCVVVVIALELERALERQPLSLARRAPFYAMAVPGLASFIAFMNGPRLETVDISVFPRILLLDLLASPCLSVFGGRMPATEFEYWGSQVPIAYVLFAIAGVALAFRSPQRRTLTAIGLLALSMLTLTLNLGGVPLLLLRELPAGAGFRVAARFLPFCYFFLLVLTALGIERTLELRSRGVRIAALSGLGLLALAELYPAKLEPSAVKQFELPREIVEDGERGAFTIVIPDSAYFNVHDTYQVSLDVPALNVSGLSREAPEARATRARRFPALYPFPRLITPSVLAQMQAANVRYVLYEDRSAYDPSIGGTQVVEHGRAILVRY